MTVSALAPTAIPMKTATATANRAALRMSEPPAATYNARLALGRRVVSTSDPVLYTPRSDSLRKWCIVAAGVLLATMLSAPGRADPPDISAQRLLSNWQEGDPGMRMLAEVIASAFASGFSWGADAGGKHVYCAPPDLKGREIMSAFAGFVGDHPQMASEPYGTAMAATLSRAFPCGGQ
jgi:Rap1a immunity proteins